MTVVPLHHDWYGQGTRLPQMPYDLFDDDFAVAFEHFGLVRMEAHRAGTVIEWAPADVDDASLDRVIDALPRYNGPFHLRYYIQGWFSESLLTGVDARRRIEELKSAVNVRLAAGFFSKQSVNPTAREMAKTTLDDIPRFKEMLVFSAVNSNFSCPIISAGDQSLLGHLQHLPVARAEIISGSNSISALKTTDNKKMVSSYKRAYETGETFQDTILCQWHCPRSRQTRWVRYERIGRAIDVNGSPAIAVLSLQLPEKPKLFAFGNHAGDYIPLRGNLWL